MFWLRLTVFFSYQTMAISLISIKEITSGQGVFTVTVCNQSDKAMDVFISVRVSSYVSGSRTGISEGYIPVPAYETCDILVQRPFYGENWEEYRGKGPDLAPYGTFTIYVQGGIRTVKTNYSVTYPAFIDDTLFVDIPPVVHTIQ